MGALSIWHLIVLLAVVMLVVGAGRRRVVSNLLSDAAKGVREFRKGLRDESSE